MTDCTDTINPLCAEKFDNIEDGVSKILANQDKFNDKLEDIHNRFFVDNGEKSYQTFRRFAEGFMKVHLWVYGLICTGIILTTVGILITHAIKN